MLKRIVAKGGREETVQSYLGLLRHGNTKKLELLVRGITDTE
jgi:hypothetical protein